MKSIMAFNFHQLLILYYKGRPSKWCYAQCTEYRVQSKEYRVQSTEYRIQSTEYKVYKYRVQRIEYTVQST